MRFVSGPCRSTFFPTVDSRPFASKLLPGIITMRFVSGPDFSRAVNSAKTDRASAPADLRFSSPAPDRLPGQTTSRDSLHFTSTTTTRFVSAARNHHDEVRIRARLQSGHNRPKTDRASAPAAIFRNTSASGPAFDRAKTSQNNYACPQWQNPPATPSTKTS